MNIFIVNFTVFLLAIRTWDNITASKCLERIFFSQVSCYRMDQDYQSCCDKTGAYSACCPKDACVNEKHQDCPIVPTGCRNKVPKSSGFENGCDYPWPGTTLYGCCDKNDTLLYCCFDSCKDFSPSQPTHNCSADTI